MLLANQTWNEIKPQPESKEFYEKVCQRKIVQDINSLRKTPNFYGNTAISTIVARFDTLQSFDDIELAVFLQNSLSVSNIMSWYGYNKSSRLKSSKRPFDIGLYRSVFYDKREILILKDLSNDNNMRSTFLSNKEILLPLTKYSGIVHKYHVTLQWVRYPFPINLNQQLSIIFESVGLYDKAWRSQLEEMYDPFYSNRERSFYLCAANNAYRAGNKKLGWSFLINAAVFEDEKSFNLAMETAKVWTDVESNKRKLPDQKILTGEERKKAFLEIVERYQKMNAHPRAWLFIQENEKEFDDPDSLIKKIQNDWLDIIKMVTSDPMLEKFIMYGVELYPAKNDPLSVKIPFPCPEDAVEKLKEKIQELADKIKKEKKDRLLD
jgi:hypothetical protein